MTTQHYDSIALETGRMIRVLPANPNRVALILQNQNSAATIYFSNSEKTIGKARLRLLPDSDLLRDYASPTGELWAMSDVDGAELTFVWEE